MQSAAAKNSKRNKGFLGGYVNLFFLFSAISAVSLIPSILVPCNCFWLQFSHTRQLAVIGILNSGYSHVVNFILHNYNKFNNE